MKLSDLINFLEEWAPPSLQESYDNAGLIVGNNTTDITKALICLDSTEAVVDEAIAEGCQLVIAHHPIVFNGLKRFNGNNYIERVVMKAIKNDIAIYAAHTNLDNIATGVNAKICEMLDLKNTRILTPKNKLEKKLVTFVPNADVEKVRAALFNAGAGVIGNYTETSFNIEGAGTFLAGAESNPTVGEKGNRHEEAETRLETIFPGAIEYKVISALINAHPYEEVAYDIYSLDNFQKNIGSGSIGELAAEMDEISFLKSLKSTMKTDCVRHTKLLGKTVKTVAVCGGSGSFLLPNAIAQGADVFITGDFKYHQFFDAENKLIIADIGHYESEQFTIDLFYEHISKKFPNFALLKSKVNTNPINYL